MNRKPYPQYKPSGVEWLGDVPEHWEVKRLKYNFQLLTAKTENRTKSIALENIESWTGRFIETETEFDGDGVAFVKDDILFGKLRPYLAKVLKADISGEAVGDFFVLRPQKTIDSNFASNYLRSKDFINIIDGSTFGSKMPRASWDFMGSVNIPLPPLPEQKTIAAFLDIETGRIDALVAKKKRLVELLREKRTALISRAVTKGLDLSVKMKQSGVEWLGDVPEHWEVKRLKFILQNPLQYGANEAAELDDPELPRFVRITDVDESGNLREETFRSLPEEVAKPFLLDEGDILFARSGATVGKSFFYRKSWGRAAYAGYLIRARLKKRIAQPDFINFITKSIFYQQWISSILIQATIQNVSAEKYVSFLIPLPPLPEQQAIAAFLDRETGKIDALIAKVETAVEKLKEYRTALISAAVTGKIEVRKTI
ncbi:MAG: restriction endonuclease subunit S [Candidatus Aminicenantes bacterium]|nr:restriction endonuclease subunit S [Candidatus Aminicenantes bacterium]